MHSHHSHSGEYVSHAVNTLNEVTEAVISKKFSIFCFTEHQPRSLGQYLYPEELQKNYSCEDLHEIFDRYVKHAREIQARTFKNEKIQTKFLVGFEVEGVDAKHIEEAIQIRKSLDMCVGSVHHVKGIPIDFDEELWIQAMKACGSPYRLFSEYFDLQYIMLQKIKPEVIGHFDLIRLKCPADLVDARTQKNLMSELDIQADWPEVWLKIIRNIQFVKSYGGLFELNSASIRKGWKTPYPANDIAQAIKKYGGSRFCLSDDSHGVAQLGLNYDKVLKYCQDVLLLDKLYYMDICPENLSTSVKAISLEQMKLNKFWDCY